MSDKTLGVYICKGCGIGDALDVEALGGVVEEEFTHQLVKSHDYLCSKEGAEMIKADIESEGLGALVIAACSPRVCYDIFSFGPQVVMERANIREQVIWSHPPNDEDTQMLAEDQLRMSIVKVEGMEPLEGFQPEEEMSKRIMVVGGGLTGLTAALEAAKAGYEVVLVEKKPELGGFLKDSHKIIPTKEPYEAPEDNPIPALVQEVENDPLIKLYKGATVEKTEGGPCVFKASIKQNGATNEESIGAIVLATGSTPYRPDKLKHLGYGEFPDVIDSVKFEEMAKEGKIVRPSDGKAAKSVAFILCAGSRDRKFLRYCSATCCLRSLKQAKYLRDLDSDAKAYIFYKDIRTLGLFESFYRAMQDDPGVFMTKGEIAGIGKNGDSLQVEATETLLGERIAVNADLVVLATGMESVASKGEEIELEDEELLDEEEVEIEEGSQLIDQIIASSMLNLEYRQGPEVPLLPNDMGFPDSHYICFPYESRRTGIYAAGTVRSPMEPARAIADATGAALKAIQCVEMVSKGNAVHPRAGDQSFPDFFMQRCTQCKRCTVECPFGAINEDEKANPIPNITRCRRCGVCMGACPERIISFKDYSVGMIGNMIKGINVPDEYDEKPRIVVLACENDAYPALDMAGINRLNYNPWMRIIPMRCLGSMNLIWVADSLSKGIDGIIFLGCKLGADYQCHFMRGSELCKIRLAKVQETLDRLALESERINFQEISISEYDKLPELFDKFNERLEELGPNPYKGF